jgi:hypothetical protein
VAVFSTHPSDTISCGEKDGTKHESISDSCYRSSGRGFRSDRLIDVSDDRCTTSSNESHFKHTQNTCEVYMTSHTAESRDRMGSDVVNVMFREVTFSLPGSGNCVC